MTHATMIPEKSWGNNNAIVPPAIPPMKDVANATPINTLIRSSVLKYNHI
jgi:hypothetical protein